MREQIDTGARFLAEFEKFAPVRAAFWLKASDDGPPYLYVASDRIDDTNVDVAYGEVLRLGGTMQDPNFDPFRIKLIAMADPLARAALEISRRYPTRIATHYRDRTFGGVGVDEVYIYPSPVTVPV